MSEDAGSPDSRIAEYVGRSERRRGWAGFVTGAVFLVGSIVIVSFDGGPPTFGFAGAGVGLGVMLVGVLYLRSARKALNLARENHGTGNSSSLR
jgi:hypothetical protein